MKWCCELDELEELSRGCNIALRINVPFETKKSLLSTLLTLDNACVFSLALIRIVNILFCCVLDSL